MKRLLLTILLLLLPANLFALSVLEAVLIPNKGFCVHSVLESNDIKQAGFIFIDFPNQMITVDTYSSTLGMSCSQNSIFNGFVYENMANELQVCLINKIRDNYRVKGYVPEGSMFFYMLQCNKCNWDARITTSVKNIGCNKGRIHYLVECPNFQCGNMYSQKMDFNFN